MNGGILLHSDDSGFQFQQEMLRGNPSAAINFDCIMHHPVIGTVIIELLQVSAEAQDRCVTPYTSHPNRYWQKNKQKFIALWNYTCDAHGTLLCVNYAPKGTKYEDLVGVLEVTGANDNGLETKQYQLNRASFSDFYIALNRECRNYEGNRHVGRISA